MKKLSLVLIILCAFFKIFADDDDKLRLAVMEFEDRSGTLSKQLLSDATEYLRSALTSANKYTVIAKERQEQAMIKEMKKESYKECNDKNCQIPLGQALSADTILRTTIMRLGKTFVIASELIDLTKEATIVGAREKYDGSEESLSIALDNIAEKVIAAYESIYNSDSSTNDNYERKENNSYSNSNNYSNNYQPTSNYNGDADRDEKRALAEAQENLEYNRKIKIAGYSMLGIGAGIVLIGGILFGVSAPSYDPSAGKDDNEGLVNGGLTMICIGSGVIVTGVIMAPIGAVREKKARIELNTLAVAPTKGGAYASVGFSF
ncbi:hypothetical protein J6Y50_04990 [bacterium]|nr:hypothetical protein [bacterium]